MSSPTPNPPANSTAPPPSSTPTTPAAPPPSVQPPPANSTSPPPPTTTPAAPPPTASPPPPVAANPSPPAPVSPSPPAPATPSASPPPPGNTTPAAPGSPPSPPTAPSPPSRPSPVPPEGFTPPPPSPDSSGISHTVVVVLAVVGGIAIFAALIGLLVCLCRRKPRRKPRPPPLPHAEAGHYKADYYDGRRPNYQGQVKPSPPPPPPPHKYHHYGPSVPPPPPVMYPPTQSHSHFDSSGSQNSWNPVPPPPPPGSLGSSRSWFTLEELEVATDGFAIANKLGEGGFGPVYRGKLPDGKLVAVKALKAGSGQGEREFRTEVEVISRVHHRHLVSLVGYCIADSQRLLVYDYVPNGTLEQHLHGRGSPVMNWATRLKIAAGAARGLAYLHEDCHPKIIHRDIKSSNILLDNDFEAQVSDFGLAKPSSDTFTHVSTRVMGTFGYLAPEYASSGKLTAKSDVFSFGVVLLELITGNRPVDPTLQDSLVEEARQILPKVLEEGDLSLIVDERLVDYNKNEMRRMIEAAAACVRNSASLRPKMGQVARALESDEATVGLNQGLRPGQSSNYGSSADYDSQQYKADMMRFRRTALTSQEYGSEVSAPTSEYGLNVSASTSEGMNSEVEKLRVNKSPDTTSSSEMMTHRGLHEAR